MAFGLKFETIYPEVRDAFNAHFSVIHASYEEGWELRENKGGAYDSRQSYERCVEDDFGTPVKSPEQMLRILKVGESLLKSGNINSQNKMIVDMYHFCQDELNKSARVRGFQEFKID